MKPKILLKTREILYFLIIGIVTSCSSFQPLTIQVSEAGESEFQDNIQSLLIVNHAVDEQFQNYQADSLQVRFYESNFNIDTTLLDSMAVDTLIKVLGDLLFESGRYDIVIPVDRYLPVKRDILIPESIEWEVVDSLCTIFNTDALLALEYYRTDIFTDFSSQTLYYTEDMNFYRGYLAEMKIAYNALFKTYDPKSKTIINSTLINDTIYWEEIDLSIKDLFNKFTPVKKALIESGISIALDFTDKIAPTWRNATRYLYIKGSPELEEAAKLTRENKWEEAMEIWYQLAQNNNSSNIKSKAEFNLALGYELLDNIDEAINWGLKSYETKYSNNIYDYLIILQNRKEEIESTNDQ